MKCETKDHGPKPLTKRFRDIQVGEYFRWQGMRYRRCLYSYVLCLEELHQYQWSSDEAANTEVDMLEPPSEERWRELIAIHFPAKMVEPKTIPVSDMEPGQVFVLPILFRGIMNARFVCGCHGSMTRLSDGLMVTNMGDCRGIPINGKFVEEDQPQ